MTETTLDQAPCGYFSFFDNSALHIVNETFCQLLGYKKNELEGKNAEFVFTIATKIFFQTHFFPIIKMHGHAEEIFISLLTKDGEHLPILMNAKRNELDGKAFTACAFIVVANRKKFEDELVEARRKAETALRENSQLVQAKKELQQHAEKLDEHIQLVKKQNDELKQLNHVLTHNLREPLRKVLLYTERIKTNNGASDLEKLTIASEQMREVISGLQEYVWLNDIQPEFEVVDLELVIKKIQKRLESEYPDQLVIKSETLPSIKGDARQIELLFYHILLNAIKFKKEKKALVEITATIMQRNRFKSLEDKYQYEDFIRLKFADNGIGFDPVFKEEAFELFRKLHFQKGMGLGLALCKKIAQNHSGTIEANSKINEGTIITVLLPLEQ
jgi:phosphoserine phosphatase RsbU/P